MVGEPNRPPGHSEQAKIWNLLMSAFRYTMTLEPWEEGCRQGGMIDGTKKVIHNR